MRRCSWTGSDELLIEYHDKEWGKPLYDDRMQFEFLSLEVMQCGLSWLTVLRKREIMRKAFDDFSVQKISLYNEDDIDRILNCEGMIRSERKIRAIINNAKAFLLIQKEFGSFSSYLWGFVGHKTVEYPSHTDGSAIVPSNELSDEISRDLKKRGFSFLGTVTVYSHLQAAGLINDHLNYCFRYRELKEIDQKV